MVGQPAGGRLIPEGVEMSGAKDCPCCGSHAERIVIGKPESRIEPFANCDQARPIGVRGRFLHRMEH